MKIIDMSFEGNGIGKFEWYNGAQYEGEKPCS